MAIDGAAAFGIGDARPSLEAEFLNPPNAARPRVWWHWINGNVTKDGIRKDLEWMSRVGIGGLQNFDVNFGVPKFVDQPLVYMSPEWNDAFRFSAELADQLHLELAIAASAGWSETGGPWVAPRDAIKKLVWSETIVVGGQSFTGQLASPPTVTGPFQKLAAPASTLAAPGKPAPQYYADVAVLAYRAAASTTLPTPTYSLSDGKTLDATALSDDKFNTGVDVPRGTTSAPTAINIHYEQSQTVRSLSLFLQGSTDLWDGPSVAVTLESSTDGNHWRKVAAIRLSMVPTTISFAPETAQQFRLLLAPMVDPQRPRATSAPGYVGAGAGALSAGGGRLRIVDLRLSPEARVNQFEAKAGFATSPDYYALDADVGADTPGIAPTNVIDLTRKLRADGTLGWKPPKGSWRVLRLGYSLTGATNSPATPEATGLEVDKLDAKAVRSYLETYLQKHRDATGPALQGAHGLNALLTDSTELGSFNWTAQLVEQFKRLRGYDARPWLPALTGVIVGSRTQSDQFLYDFRRTVGELHATEHYGTVAKVAHEHGLKVYGESFEGWRPSLGDDLDTRRYADVPMAALWTFNREDGPKPTYLADMRGATSVAHLYGQNLLAAESMTSTRYPFSHAPADLRRVVDQEFASGVNRVVIHTSPHQPLDDKQPGMSLRHIGQFFSRHETWAEMARPWIDYIARSSYLLQQGRFVADVAYFVGEEAPVGPQISRGDLNDVPVHYAYDYVNAAALREVLTVDHGDLAAPSGARYRLLYLGGSSARMTLPTLRRIAALAGAGATIVGDAPTSSPALREDTAEYRALLRRLWSGHAVTTVGSGRVIAGKNVEGALHLLNVTADFEFTAASAEADSRFVHRRLADGDIYFLSNRNNTAARIEARFRVSGKAPEIWRADTGAIAPVSYRIVNNQTVVPLSFDGEKSYFVVFRHIAAQPSQQIANSAPVPAAALAGSWSVSFQPGRGAPAATMLTTLAPLNDNADLGIRFFSGIATYSKSFSTPAAYRPGAPLWLDLGSVGDLAEVMVSGRSAGTVWHPPYRVDIGDSVRPGDNQLEIRVANLWVNRLIGAAQPGARKIAFTLMPTYKTDAPLRAAGLIGPVQLLTGAAR